LLGHNFANFVALVQTYVGFLKCFGDVILFIPTAASDRGTTHGGEWLPRQPHSGGDGGAARDAGKKGCAERRVQRRLDCSHRQPDEGQP